MEVTYIREPTEEEVSKVPKWSATSKRILQVIKTKRSVSTVELSCITGYKLSTINAQISILRRMGLIENTNSRIRNSSVTESFNPSMNRQLGIELIRKDKESAEEKSLEKPKPETEEKVPLIPSQEINDIMNEIRKSAGEINKYSVENMQLDIASKFPADTILNGRKFLYDTCFKHGYDVILACNDVLEFLKGVPENTVTLVVTSPPYNIGKAYEERVEFKEYLEWQKDVIGRCVDILKPDGSICWEVGNYIEEGEVFPLDVFFYNIFKKLGLKLKNRIIWHFGHGLHASKRFSGRYEVILWFTKSDDYVFNLDAVRVPQKYPGKRAYKGPNKGKPSGHPLGKNPSDKWDILLQDWENEMWDIPNVKCNHPEKTIHPSQFPIELVERLLLALTNEGDVVFDPFVGVGSSIIAALLHNRKGIGVDKEKLYTDIAYQRIIAALKGTLRKRPLGKPVYEPKGTEKVVRTPPEWQTKSLAEFTK